MIQYLLLQIVMKSCIDFIKKIVKKIHCLLIWCKQVRALKQDLVKSSREWWRAWSRDLNHKHYWFSSCDWNTKDQVFPFKDFHNHYIEVEDELRQLLAYLGEEVGDVIYYHQCIKQPNAPEFVKVFIKEINGYVHNKNWELVDRSTVPEGVKVIPSVWWMRCMQDLVTNQVTKDKACLNFHGCK